MKSKKCYRNPYQKKDLRSLSHFVLWKMGYYDDPHPPLCMPQLFSYPLPKEETYDPKAPTAIWINHSTFLLEIEGIRFLTDPIWSDRCSPLGFAGPKRRHAPALEIEALPPIDYVLISHDHYDHLDKKSVEQLFIRFPEMIWLVPMGVKKWFVKLGITRVFELNWWEQILLPGVEATFVPAQHFSGRRGYDVNKTLWGGFVVETKGKRFYFVGDTGYNPFDFKKVGEKWGFMDLSLIPIGSYSPRRFMSAVHVEPADAVKIHRDVGSRLSLGMHWRTFRLSDEPLHQPPYDLYLALKEAGIHPMHFLAPHPGRPINF